MITCSECGCYVSGDADNYKYNSCCYITAKTKLNSAAKAGIKIEFDSSKELENVECCLHTNKGVCRELEVNHPYRSLRYIVEGLAYFEHEIEV